MPLWKNSPHIWLDLTRPPMCMSTVNAVETIATEIAKLNNRQELENEDGNSIVSDFEEDETTTEDK